ncbi:MAG: cell division protein FtsA [Candidatus Marinimicrobia bacterium]|nr:cell division protein FtsA [Candidatus Neomarinimicrobiota bacterium]|tara:strand:- start:1843 stop:3105 length:1263 start_codon:yes stop_codon:yes gene_type:complete
MSDKYKNEIITVIDIGTTKIIVLIAEYDLEKNKIIKVLGFGDSYSDGLKRGVVVDIGKTINSITNAVESAEKQAGFEVSHAFVGISGDHISSLNYSGVTSINSNSQNQAIGHSITYEDIEKVQELAANINISPDRRIMHVLPQEYIVDEQEGISSPLGLSGRRLEAKVHLVTSSINTERDILTCLDEININVIDFILEPLASAYSVLNPDEMNLGSILIDIGGGTTDVITYANGSVLHTGVVPIGGTIITNDIAYRVQTSIEQAEELKQHYGSSNLDEANSNDDIIVKGVAGRSEFKISQKILSEVIEPRVREIFELAKAEIEKSNFNGDYTFGVILTGGGSKLNGIMKTAYDVFDMPIKKGLPINDFEVENIDVDILDPRYATAVGLIKYAGQNFNNYNKINQNSFITMIKNFIKELIK